MAKIYEAINKIQADLNKVGITKDRKNQQQGYSFRGIDDVYNALSPLLAKHGVCILPRVLSRSSEWRETAKGGQINYVVVEAEFDFVCAEDQSMHTCKTFGEAMDSADKATNKAMSAAYKYVTFQAFSIPTEGDNDADEITPPATTKRSKDEQKEKPKGFADWQAEIANIDAVPYLENWYKKHRTEWATDKTLEAKIATACGARKKEIIALLEKNTDRGPAQRPCPARNGDMMFDDYCVSDCPNRDGCPAWP